MHPLETYLRRLHEIRSTERGTPELSYRAALENLLNAVGSGLNPGVQATAELADTGAGRPDFGLVDAHSGDLRGAVEVKSVAEDTPQTADGRVAGGGRRRRRASPRLASTDHGARGAEDEIGAERRRGLDDLTPRDAGGDVTHDPSREPSGGCGARVVEHEAAHLQELRRLHR